MAKVERLFDIHLSRFARLDHSRPLLEKSIGANSWLMPHYNWVLYLYAAVTNSKSKTRTFLHSDFTFIVLLRFTCSFCVTGCLYIYFAQWICCITEAKIIIQLSITNLLFHLILRCFGRKRMFITVWHFIYFLMSMEQWIGCGSRGQSSFACSFALFTHTHKHTHNTYNYFQNSLDELLTKHLKISLCRCYTNVYVGMRVCVCESEC